ncbi:hypothetical protein MCY_01409 [Bartonella rattimassiliensis 15908]|uniref:Uncharacterized protein n=1 Tax=Bartonella rattimassiliensis 15908 TaxID=1094556 RepID=J1JJN9_9HYPH|nr:hypothetical protein MCY_01409 [Bartonella rattimassiliensis 15908]
MSTHYSNKDNMLYFIKNALGTYHFYHLQKRKNNCKNTVKYTLPFYYNLTCNLLSFLKRKVFNQNTQINILKKHSKQCIKIIRFKICDLQKLIKKKNDQQEPSIAPLLKDETQDIQASPIHNKILLHLITSKI